MMLSETATPPGPRACASDASEMLPQAWMGQCRAIGKRYSTRAEGGGCTNLAGVALHRRPAAQAERRGGRQGCTVGRRGQRGKNARRQRDGSWAAGGPVGVPDRTTLDQTLQRLTSRGRAGGGSRHQWLMERSRGGRDMLQVSRRAGRFKRPRARWPPEGQRKAMVGNGKTVNTAVSTWSSRSVRAESGTTACTAPDPDEPRPTAAMPMENPYYSCGLTRVGTCTAPSPSSSPTAPGLGSATRRALEGWHIRDRQWTHYGHLGGSATSLSRQCGTVSRGQRVQRW